MTPFVNACTLQPAGYNPTKVRKSVWKSEQKVSFLQELRAKRATLIIHKFSCLFTFKNSMSAICLHLWLKSQLFVYIYIKGTIPGFFVQMRLFWWFSSSVSSWFVSKNRQESPSIENVIVHDSKAAKDIKRFLASSFMVTDNRST